MGQSGAAETADTTAEPRAAPPQTPSPEPAEEFRKFLDTAIPDEGPRFETWGAFWKDFGRKVRPALLHATLLYVLLAKARNVP